MSWGRRVQRAAHFAAPLAAMAAAVCLLLWYLQGRAPAGSTVKLLGGLLPGRFVLMALVLILVLKIWRLWNWSDALSRQTGAAEKSLLFASARGFLEGGLMGALLIGALNPAIRPGPLLILDLPAWEKDNWLNTSDGILERCLSVKAQHSSSGVRIVRSRGAQLVPDPGFQRALELGPQREGLEISQECRERWLSALRQAYDETLSGRAKREIYHALWLIRRDLSQAGTEAEGTPRLNLADQQVIYIVSLGEATAKRICFPNSAETLYPVPAARGVACLWRSVNRGVPMSEEARIEGHFWTQAPYYVPRFVLSYQVPIAESLPRIEVTRFVGETPLGGAPLTIPPLPSGTLPAPDGAPYLTYATSRVGSSASLALEGPGLTEDFGRPKPFDRLQLTWTAGGKSFQPIFELDPQRRLTVLDHAGVLSKYTEVGKAFRVLNSAPDGERANVQWVSRLSAEPITEPTIIITFSGESAGGAESYFNLRAPLMGGALRPEFQRGWRAYGTAPTQAPAMSCYYLEADGQPDRPIAWFEREPKPGRPAILHLNIPEPNTSWLTGNHRDAIVYLLQSLSSAAAADVTRLPLEKATVRWRYGDVGQDIAKDTAPPAEIDQPLWRSIIAVLWPLRDRDDFYIPVGDASLRQNCLVMALACLAGVFVLWCAAVLTNPRERRRSSPSL